MTDHPKFAGSEQGQTEEAGPQYSNAPFKRSQPRLGDPRETIAVMPFVFGSFLVSTPVTPVTFDKDVGLDIALDDGTTYDFV